MKKGEQAARAAIHRALQQRCPQLLFDLSCDADAAARAAGRKTELFPSLFDYERLLPHGYRGYWKRGWLTGADDGIYMVGTIEQAQDNYRPHPGAFDAAVDMGPQCFADVGGL